MKKSSELGTTSDLVVVHTLIFSLWGVPPIGLRNQTRLTLSFVTDQHLFCSSGSLHFLGKIHSNAFDCLDLDCQRVVYQFEVLKLSSYSLKFKLVGPNVEEIVAVGELKCIQRHLIVGQQTRMTSRGQKMWNAKVSADVDVYQRQMYIVEIQS